MRILLVTAYFRPHVGGVERFVEVLARGLGARGHEVTVLACRTSGEALPIEQAGGYRVCRVRATNVIERRLSVPYPLPDVVALQRRLGSLTAATDVAHVQDALYVTSQLAIRSAASARVPVIVTQHVEFVPQRNKGFDLLERGAIRLAAPGVRRASRVVSYNPAVAEWARRTWGLPGVDVLPSGVVVPELQRSRRELGLPEDKLVALFVGRDVPKKGLRHVLDSVDPAYELVVVTDAAVTAQEGLQVRAFMAPDDLMRLLRSVDALVMPSKGEGIPLIIQEAAVAGVPVVTTRNPGYDRYFGLEDVLFVEPTGASIRAALRMLRDDPELRARLARRSAAVGARHFGEEAFVSAYEQAYRDLVPGVDGG